MYPPAQILSRERAARGDQLACGIHLIPDIPEQDATHAPSFR